MKLGLRQGCHQESVFIISYGLVLYFKKVKKKIYIQCVVTGCKCNENEKLFLVKVIFTHVYQGYNWHSFCKMIHQKFCNTHMCGMVVLKMSNIQLHVLSQVSGLNFSPLRMTTFSRQLVPDLANCSLSVRKDEQVKS